MLLFDNGNVWKLKKVSVLNVRSAPMGLRPSYFAANFHSSCSLHYLDTNDSVWNTTWVHPVQIWICFNDLICVKTSRHHTFSYKSIRMESNEIQPHRCHSSEFIHALIRSVCVQRTLTQSHLPKEQTDEGIIHTCLPQ